MFCVAIFLAAAVQSSPINVDETDAEVVNNEIAAEPESEQQAFNVDEETVNEEEQPVDVEEPAEANENVEEVNDVAGEETIVHLKNELSEDEVAVPYGSEVDEGVEGEAFIDDEESEEEEEMTPEEKERIVGIEIPLCAQYSDDQVALHLR